MQVHSPGQHVSAVRVGEITHNGVADVGGVDAELVAAARDRFQEDLKLNQCQNIATLICKTHLVTECTPRKLILKRDKGNTNCCF